MKRLEDGMLLYHGSFVEVSHIDLQQCRPGKDFGRGFYVTSSYEQAKRFVRLSVNKQVHQGSLPHSHSYGYVSIYRLHLNDEIRIHLFEQADKDWLHFVASNRRSSLFASIRKAFEAYDIIGGKIANDRTARTLQLYTAGGYGQPGTQEADAIAIATLLPNRLEDQFCFCNSKAVQALEFIRSERHGIDEK